MPHRVLIDGRLLGYRYGGIATYARQLARLAPFYGRSLDINIATSRDIPEFADRSVRMLTPPHHRFERLTFGLEVALRRSDLLHSVDYVIPKLPRAVRTVATVHDLAFLSHPELVTADSYSYYVQSLESLTEADRVITVSESTREQLLSHVEIDPMRVSVIPNGYDDSTFSASEDPVGDAALLSRLDPFLSRSTSRGRPIVLAVGTIEPRKRFDILVNAFEHHIDVIEQFAGDRPVLVIAGQSGWLADDTVRNMRKLMQRGDAAWARSVHDRELAALYRSASLLAMPSLDEGFGLPVLEAMASGTPSLFAELNAVKEIIGDDGFLEKSPDPARWAEKIGRILADREIRERRAKRGIERASNFTWRETVRLTVDVYRGVLGE